VPYSLIPTQYLITLEDVERNYWNLPMKLYKDEFYIWLIVFIIMVFWGFAIIDLMYYYWLMEFPNEKVFKK